MYSVYGAGHEFPYNTMYLQDIAYVGYNIILLAYYPSKQNTYMKVYFIPTGVLQTREHTKFFTL